MAYEFYLGVDVTEADGEPVATLSLIEKSDEGPDGKTVEDAVYYVRRIERTTDLDGEGDDEGGAHLADHVQNLLAEQQFVGRGIVAVNRTRQAGQVAMHALTERGLTPVGFTITGGESAAQEGTGVELSGGDSAVPEESSLFASEIALAERLLMLERTGRLHLEQGNANDYVSNLAHGLQSYRAELDEAEATEGAETLGEAQEVEGDPGQVDTQGESAADAVEAEGKESDRSEAPPRRAAHSAFVISAGMGCWLGEERSFNPAEHLAGDPPTTGEAKRQHRPDTASGPTAP